MTTLITILFIFVYICGVVGFTILGSYLDTYYEYKMSGVSLYKRYSMSLESESKELPIFLLKCFSILWPLTFPLALGVFLACWLLMHFKIGLLVHFVCSRVEWFFGLGKRLANRRIEKEELVKQALKNLES